MRIAGLVDYDPRELHLNRHGTLTFSLGGQGESESITRTEGLYVLTPASWRNQSHVSDHRRLAANRQRNRRDITSGRDSRSQTRSKRLWIASRCDSSSTSLARVWSTTSAGARATNDSLFSLAR